VRLYLVACYFVVWLGIGLDQIRFSVWLVIDSDANYLSTKVLKYVLKYFLGTYLLVLKYFRKLVLSTYT